MSIDEDCELDCPEIPELEDPDELHSFEHLFYHTNPDAFANMMRMSADIRRKIYANAKANEFLDIPER